MKQSNRFFVKKKDKQICIHFPSNQNEYLWKLWLKFVHAAQENRIRTFWNATNN